MPPEIHATFLLSIKGDNNTMNERKEELIAPNKSYSPGEYISLGGRTWVVISVAHTGAEIEAVSRDKPERRIIPVAGPRNYKVVVDLPVFGRQEVFVEAQNPGEAIDKVGEMPILDLLGQVKVVDIANTMWTERQA
jgi:hypothetical protein